MFRSMIVVALAPLWAGCSTLAPEDPDLTPMNPTAVRETRIVSTGVKDFATFTSASVTYTRPNMQRSEYSFNAKNGVQRYQDKDPQVRIDVLDRKIGWRLDPRGKKAIECPLQGCISTGTRKAAGKSPEQDKARESHCRLKMGNATLKVVSTGEKRNINGVDTEQYDIKWLVTLRDNAARKATGTLSVDLWTAPITLALDDAIALERTYARARDRIFSGSNDMTRPGLLPHEVDTLLNGYLAQSVTPADRASLLAAMNKVDEAKGYPILMRVKWTIAGTACSIDEAPYGAGDKPLFVLTWEVRSHKLVSLHDSLFAPPKGYKIRKE
jgi:hypothetical protein